MKNRVVFYLPKGALFEATAYYCDLIKSAVKNIEEINEVLYAESIDEIHSEDIVVTIRINDPFIVSGKCRKVIHWFQGVAPEERIMMGKGSLYSRFAATKYFLMELILLRKPVFFFFVSQAMKEHYAKKYKTDLNERSAIMPCYNIPLNIDSFMVEGKYSTASFVYAGGILNWQCVRESLEVYKAFKQYCPKATFTILTKDSGRANKLIKEVDVSGVFVKFVPLESLQEELGKYKYGFILRKNHIVNKVSTPTKMNSYLSAGVIPIYTTAVADFDRNIDLGNFELKFDSLNVDSIVTKLLEFEEKSIDCNLIFQTFKKVFQQYYDDVKHIEMIRGKLKHYLAV
ncbi:hypothetical protein [Sphingobacterium athyrii]|uniref:Glycosyltransferase n=1 Tax=Sphingobacterium athyrii TaxID=2152717 RepID=A0A363NQ88_9SPHI|nr:hypothetical protein [Sphingobacterium athyrii]PUV22965.1 hypothetical protein DCO56_18775 [Sphingobacterium athyrii]